jgi:hypothetical protein
MRRVSANPLLHWWIRLRRFFVLLPFLFLGGCAKFPTTAVGDSTRVIFRMQMRGEIRSDYVYIFAIRTSTDLNPTGDGPIPVIQFPTNNGFVAGNADYFVRWSSESRQYTLYKFTDSTLNFNTPIGVPINTVDVSPGSRTLGFELSLEQLVATPGTSNQLQSLQVNLLTMNRILDSSSGSSRIIDALGDTRRLLELNQPVRIPLATSAIYDNARFANLEPLDSDCPDPDLDISDWSIEVRRQ